MATFATSPGVQPLQAQAPWQSGRYYFVPPVVATATSAALGNATMNAVPAYVPNGVTLTRIGAEITSAGDVGSKLRLGIYNDDGTGRPGTLVIDAGTIAGDSVAVQEVSISQAIGAGIFWFVGAVQLVTVTQPTVRTVTTGWPTEKDIGTAAPTAGQSNAAWSAAAVGALPSPFGALSSSGGAPRIFVKVA